MSGIAERLRASVTYAYMPMQVRREQAEAAETIEVLLDALRPFASAADNFDASEDPGEFWRPDDDADGVVSIAHLRAARAAVRKATS